MSKVTTICIIFLAINLGLSVGLFIQKNTTTELQSDLANQKEDIIVINQRLAHQENVNEQMANLFSIQNKINKKLAGVNDDN